MRAVDLLAVTSNPVYCAAYEGICLEVDDTMLPVTCIVKGDDMLIFRHDSEHSEVTINNFYKVLMLNRKLELYYEQDVLAPIFGFKEKDCKVVITVRLNQ